ncbi:electron transport complex subunit RsxC [Spongorhabdus nitratireducens]
MSRQIHAFPGGVHPPENKDQSSHNPIALPPLPAELTLPLNQHSGAPAKPVVSVGDKVLKGQLLAKANGFVSAPVHAPTSGTITAIEVCPVPHPSGLEEPCIILQSDGEDRWAELEPVTDYTAAAKDLLLQKIHDAGVVGLGGAGFPAAVKMASRTEDKIHTVVVNGAECEPYITADDRLMRERADKIVGGILILRHLLNPKEIIIGIEDNKPEAVDAMRAACKGKNIEVAVVPTRYPSGDAQRLIYLLTGKEVPNDARSVDIGILCYNVGTLAAVHDAIVEGKPLISRITTLTGEALKQPQNVEALIGTPADHLLEFSGLKKRKLHSLVLGGPMMGHTLERTDMPVLKTTNCLIAATWEEFPPAPTPQECIRCGLCSEACPVSLLPQQLYWHSKAENHDQLNHHNLFDCIECGACAYVCPSAIPLVQYYRASKGEIRQLQAKQQKAEYSKKRFEDRQARLEAEKAAREAKRKANAERAAQLKKEKAAAAANPAAAKPEDSAKADEVKAALARATARKATEGKAGRPQLSAKQKELKIQLSMVKAQLKKSERALADAKGSEETNAQLQTNIDKLKAQVATLEKEFEQAAQAPVAAAPEQPAKKAKPVLNEQQKKLKIESAMARAAVKKAQRALDEAGKSAANIDELKQTLQQAQTKADELEAAMKAAADAPAPEPAADKPVKKPKPALSDAQKKLKIEAAMARAAVKKAQRALDEAGDTPELKQALQQAQEKAAEVEAAMQAAAEAPEPAPAEEKPARKAKPVLSDAQKKLKIEAAMARAAVKKAQRALDEAGDDPELKQALQQAQAKAAELEAAMQAAAEAPAPEPEPTPAPAAEKPARKAKPVLSDEQKKLKIEAAMARAAVKKAQRALDDAGEDAANIDELKQTLQQAQAAADAAAEALDKASA